MQTVTTKAIAKVAAVATGLAMATSMLSLAPIAHAAALTDAQVQSILSLLTSFGADSATIANVQASLTGGTPSVPSTPATSSSCSFTRSLTTGASGSDVTCLQQALIAAGYSIPAGATGYFGSQTVAGFRLGRRRQVFLRQSVTSVLSRAPRLISAAVRPAVPLAARPLR